MLILDTNVLSELMKVRPEPRVLTWVNLQTPLELFTTSITVAELYYGLGLLPEGKRRQQLVDVVRLMIEEDFYQRVLPFESEAAQVYGEIAAQRRLQGKPIAQADAQIAAIARVHQATLVTRNTADFLDCGLELINPW